MFQLIVAVVIIVIAVVALALILGGVALALAFASMPALGLAEAVGATAAPGSESMRLIALASGIALIAAGVGLGLRLRRRLWAVFAVRGRGQFFDFLAYFLIATLVAGGLLGLSRVTAGVNTALEYGSNGQLPWLLGLALLAPLAWWLLRRLLLKGTA
jgi:hypothetical protein